MIRVKCLCSVAYLKWYNNNKYLLLSVRQYMLDECPANAYQQYGDEQQYAAHTVT